MQSFPVTIPIIFNQLIVLVNALLLNYTEEVAEIINKIFEIFTNAVKVGLHECLTIENIDDGFNLLKKIIDRELPTEMTLPSKDPINDERSNSVFWLNKENCQIYISEFIQNKLGFTKVDKSDHVSLTFLSKYALSFLESFLLSLLKSKTEFVPSKIQTFCLNYLNKFLQFFILGGFDLHFSWERKETNISQTYNPIPDFKQLILSQFELIMLEILLPSLVMTTEDYQLFQDYPEQFIEKEYNSFGDSCSRTLAKEILQNILQISDNDYLLNFLQNTKRSNVLYNWKPKRYYYK